MRKERKLKEFRSFELLNDEKKKKPRSGEREEVKTLKEKRSGEREELFFACNKTQVRDQATKL